MANFPFTPEGCQTDHFGPQHIILNIALFTGYVTGHNTARCPKAMTDNCDAFVRSWDFAAKVTWDTKTFEVHFIEVYQN
jgi:hypothetical protein